MSLSATLRHSNPVRAGFHALKACTQVLKWLCAVYLCIGAAFAYAEASASQRTILNAESRQNFQQAFIELYQQELPDIKPCPVTPLHILRLCSQALKNDETGPYVLFHPTPKATVVLFHGLSDTPFFVRSIAQHLYQQGYTVVAPLTPGHGKKQADADMQDPQLQARWYAHTEQLMAATKSLSPQSFIGGFSTGGALATYYALQHPAEIKGLLLFSGALQLSGNAEAMSKIWGIKWVAKMIDGDYQTRGPNPYKYPSVAGYSGLVLMDVIKDVRAQLDEFETQNVMPSLPIFVAHSLADKVTLFEGVKSLTQKVKGEHTVFTIDEEYDLCHADLPIDSAQLIAMNFDKAQVKEYERCAVPKANPLHRQMLNMLGYYLTHQH